MHTFWLGAPPPPPPLPSPEATVDSVLRSGTQGPVRNTPPAAAAAVAADASSLLALVDAIDSSVEATRTPAASFGGVAPPSPIDNRGATESSNSPRPSANEGTNEGASASFGSVMAVGSQDPASAVAAGRARQRALSGKAVLVSAAADVADATDAECSFRASMAQLVDSGSGRRLAPPSAGQFSFPAGAYIMPQTHDLVQLALTSGAAGVFADSGPARTAPEMGHAASAMAAAAEVAQLPLSAGSLGPFADPRFIGSPPPGTLPEGQGYGIRVDDGGGGSREGDGCDAPVVTTWGPVDTPWCDLPSRQ